jgi:hypothetical protein
MIKRRLALIIPIVCAMTAQPIQAIEGNLGIPEGRQPNASAQSISEIRASERRRIPLDVMLRTSNHYVAGRPVIVTVVVTNLFDDPLILNSRMLVNHPRLQGEVSFYIVNSTGQKQEIKRLITPLSVRDSDFITLTRGESIQRSVDLADLYGIAKKGQYKLYASYHNEMDQTMDSQKAWTGIVWSDPVDIQLD